MAPRARLRRQLLAAVTSSRPMVPEAGRLVWTWFKALHGARRYSMAGPEPITFAEIAAWARVTRTPLEPHHVELLRAMDEAWMGSDRKARGNTAAGMKTLPPISGKEMSGAMFDLMFA